MRKRLPIPADVVQNYKNVQRLELQPSRKIKVTKKLPAIERRLSIISEEPTENRDEMPARSSVIFTQDEPTGGTVTLVFD